MPSERTKFTEEELASAAEIYFRSKGWDLYPEVVLANFGGRADFVGTKHGLCMAVECKVTFSYAVLEQLTRWQHEFSVACKSKFADESRRGIPHLLYAVVGGSCNLGHLKTEIVERHRIGVIVVTKDAGLASYIKRPPHQFDELGYGSIGDDRWRFDEIIAPRIQHGSRRMARNIIRQLDPDMLCGTAGASGTKGGYMTPFKRTMNKAREVISDGKEWHIAAIIREINLSKGGHHYTNDASAKSQISKFLVDFGYAVRVDSIRPVFRAITE